MGLSTELQVSAPELSAHQQVCPKVGCAMISQCSFMLVSLYPVGTTGQLPDSPLKTLELSVCPEWPPPASEGGTQVREHFLLHSSFPFSSLSFSLFPSSYLAISWSVLQSSWYELSVIFLSVLWELFHMYMYFLLYVWDEVSSQPSTLPSWSPSISPGFS